MGKLYDNPDLFLQRGMMENTKTQNTSRLCDHKLPDHAPCTLVKCPDCGDFMEEQIIHKILSVLSSNRFPVNHEKDTQEYIDMAFKRKGLLIHREYKLDEKNIPDFFVDGIAIEVKIKGNAKRIYKQCERYCAFPEVKALILVTNRSMGFPEQINGVNCYYLNIAKAWL